MRPPPRIVTVPFHDAIHPLPGEHSSHEPAAEPPEAVTGQGQGEGGEDRGLGPLEGPVAAGGLIADREPDAAADKAATELMRPCDGEQVAGTVP
jgi:hypothetical protein